MFKINRRTDYAIRVMLSLAKRPFGERLSTQAIQDETLVPRPFLQRIIADLSRTGLIHTYPGPSGGLQLAHPAQEVNLHQIWEAIEGPLQISECIAAPQDCPLSTGCPVRRRWGRLQNLIVAELQASTLDQLAREAQAGPPGQRVALDFPAVTSCLPVNE